MNKPLYHVRPIKDLKGMITKSTELYGDKTAFLIKKRDNTFTNIKYKQYKADIDALGTALVNLGLLGCKIALLSENRYEWCTAYLSIVNGTGIVVPLDKELPESEIQNLITMSGACALFFSGKHEASIKKIRGLLPELIHLINFDTMEDSDGILSYTKLMQKGYDLVNSGDTSFIDSCIDNNAMNMLIYTSGTTGVAKGVMLSHTNICSDMMAVCSDIQLSEADSSLSILPIHHTYEATCGFLVMIYNGCTLSFNEGLKHISKNLKETKPTILFLVPLILESMYKKIWDQAGKKFGMKTFLRISVAFSDFLLNNLGIDIRKKLFRSIHENLGGRVRLVISGAAALNPDVSKGLRSFGIRVLQGYGMTECSPIIAVNTDRLANDSSVGSALSCMEVKIENPNKEGIGEVVVKGPNVMLGYYNNPTATNKVLIDGWMHTGDLGRLDDDGLLYITGRLKNVIVTKTGKNIYPEEVETYLNNSPYILESLVWGNLDEETGETLICAQIVPCIDKIKKKLKQDNPADDDIRKLIGQEIKNINKNMPVYKHIRDFSIRENEFAKTTTKKIKRHLEKPVK